VFRVPLIRVCLVLAVFAVGAGGLVYAVNHLLGLLVALADVGTAALLLVLATLARVGSRGGVPR
jgi:hypothetical protein